MRRKDRQVCDTQSINAIIDACKCLRLGLVDEGEAYIVPLSFGYTYINGEYTFYVHSASEGRKIELMRRNSSVSFEMDTECSITPAEVACGFSTTYKSVMGVAAAEFLQSTAQKKAALNEIMRHNAGSAEWEYSEEMLNRICVIALRVKEISAKANC